MAVMGGMKMSQIPVMGEISANPTEDGGGSVYRFQNETGEGTITIYEVFPASRFLITISHAVL